jgi:hypothetical protein
MIEAVVGLVLTITLLAFASALLAFAIRGVWRRATNAQPPGGNESGPPLGIDARTGSVLLVAGTVGLLLLVVILNVVVGG